MKNQMDIRQNLILLIISSLDIGMAASHTSMNFHQKQYESSVFFLVITLLAICASRYFYKQVLKLTANSLNKDLTSRKP